MLLCATVTSDSSTLGLGKGRLEALSDGIFATVMTVLVLSLSVPVIATPESSSALNADVTTDVIALGPNILGYVLSFLLLAVMWVSHHNIFHYLRKVDRTSIWLNIIFLLSVGFVPFSTALLGRYPLLQLPVIIYGVNVVGIAASMLGFLGYSWKSGLLVAEGHDSVLVQRIIGRWRIGMAIYGSAILLSFVSTAISLAIYVFVLVFLVLQSALGYRQPRQKPE
jgi:uncharacterized membrane protein